MISLKKQAAKGFTIVELLIVIVVIGILATLVITTYNGVQQKARDTKRKTDINSIQGQLEAFTASKGYYPSLTDMNTVSFRSAQMKGLDTKALQDPRGSAATLVATPAANVYAYAVSNSSGSSCESDDTTCAQYTLTATLEDGTTYVKTGSN